MCKKIEIWPYEQMVYAQPNIKSYGTLPYKRNTKSRPEDQTLE